MSENLSILDGELRRQFAPVDRLSVSNQGGGESRWVVADFLDISTLDASENGLYLAAEDDCDAYEEVEVSSELEEGDYRKITGKDPNLDPNNDYAVGLDENGNLTKEMIPAAIHIVVPPRKLKYEEGETIDFDGIHVYLMDGNNKRYTDAQYPTGEIPFEELIFPVTIAEGGGERWEGDGITALKTTFVQTTITDGYVHATKPKDGYVTDIPIGSYEGKSCYIGGWQTTNSCSVLLTKYGDSLYAASLDGQQQSLSWNLLIDEDRGGEERYGSYQGVGATGRYTLDEKFGNVSWGLYAHNIPESTINPKGININELTATSQEIPVQWMRSDGEILEDTFEIEVGESGEPSPPQPDPWGGYADVSRGGHHYNLNRRIVPEVHYANGYLWQEGTSEYTVEQAASMGWLILIR